jgi:cytochrome P450
MTQTTEPQPLPTIRTCPFDPPEELARLRAAEPVSSLLYVDGSVGWLVTGHAQAQTVLADRRFSARKELQKLPVQWAGQMEREPAGPGEFIFMDPPQHTRFRKLLVGHFTMRRMRQLTPRIEEITAGRLDAMQEAGSPVDLMQVLAYPIPSLVICELVGLPYEQAHELHGNVVKLFEFDSTPEQVREAGLEIHRMLHALMRRKRAQPADDLMSGLVSGGQLSVEEILRVASLLLIGGFDNTANMIGLGVFALLSNPGQLALLRDHPDLIDNAAEELMRYVPSLHIGPIRAALEDVELGGQLIKAGDVVTVSLAAVNRDPLRFGEPDQLDITSPASGQLAFGHGPHQCIGSELARIEMRVAYNALLRRFPDLRLAVPADDVPMREKIVPYGPRALPVAWGAAS